MSAPISPQEFAERTELAIDLTGAFTVGRLGSAMGLAGSQALMNESAALLSDLALLPEIPPESGSAFVAGRAAMAALWKASGKMLQNIGSRPLLWASSIGVVTLSAGGYSWLTADQAVQLEAIQAKKQTITSAIDAIAKRCEEGDAASCSALTQFIKDASAQLPTDPQPGWLYPVIFLGGLGALAWWFRR